MKTVLSAWFVLLMSVFCFAELGVGAPADPEEPLSYSLPERYTAAQFAAGVGYHGTFDGENIHGVDAHLMLLSKGYRFSDTWAAHVHLRPELAYYQSFAPKSRGMITGTVSGVLYPCASSGAFAPFVEVTFGGTYSAYEIHDLGTRWNFLTGAGIGADFTVNSVPMFVAGRFAHISNAGLDENNGGCNWITFLLGVYF